MRARMAATVAFAAAVLIGVPSAGLALESLGGGSNLRDAGNRASFTPASVDPDMARFVAERGSDVRMTRFTPAGMSDRANRSMTVAVRVNEGEARAISVRSAIQAARDKMAGAQSGLPIAPTRYNLGLSRGYQNFAKPPVVARVVADPAIPDLAEFRPSPVMKDAPSRFAARIDMEEERTGAAPRTLNARGDQTVDVAGSYRLTRNLDVTAGVRYSQDRDRIAPIVDPSQKDSQAVYIGTQFRF